MLWWPNTTPHLRQMNKGNLPRACLICTRRPTAGGFARLQAARPRQYAKSVSCRVLHTTGVVKVKDKKRRAMPMYVKAEHKRHSFCGQAATGALVCLLPTIQPAAKCFNATGVLEDGVS